MKKLICLCILLCLLASGCAPVAQDNLDKSDTTAGQDGNTTLPPSPSEQIGEDAAKTRLAYYEELVASLQEELLALKTAFYVERMEYESRIDTLQETINSLSSSTPPVENAPSFPFSYLLRDGGAIIQKYTGSAREVQIPASIDGFPVVYIADEAFAENVKLEAVTIPEGVVGMGWFAFSGCVSLSHVSIPESVKSISYGAFLNCSDSLVVRCPKGSYADGWAQSYGYGIER